MYSILFAGQSQIAYFIREVIHNFRKILTNLYDFSIVRLLDYSNEYKRKNADK
jgi:hypothetical protein